MTASLEPLDRRVVRLRDRSYRWIDIKRFGQSTPDQLDPREALALLLAHPSYQDDYASPEGATDAPIHGPYRIDAVSLESFDQVSAIDAEADLTSWLEQFGRVETTEVEGDLDQVYELFREASALFRLRELGKEAQHDWGWVVGKTGFHEFVVISPEGEVVLIVGSDD